MPDKDEAAGSSPARPTIPVLTCGNTRLLSPTTAAAAVRRLRTAALEPIPVRADRLLGRPAAVEAGGPQAHRPKPYEPGKRRRAPCDAPPTASPAGHKTAPGAGSTGGSRRPVDDRVPGRAPAQPVTQ